MALCKIVLSLCLVCLSAFANAQLHFSVEADFVEEVTDGGSFNTVSKGHVCFDVRNNTLVTEYYYPLRTTVRLTFMTMEQYVGEEVVSSPVDSSVLKSSVLFRAVTGDFSMFASDDFNYRISDVSKNDGKIYTDFVLSESLPDSLCRKSETICSLKTSQTDNKLDASVCFDVNGKVMAKIFYYNYQTLGASVFPSTVVSVSYGEKELYSKVVYSDVSFDKNHVETCSHNHVAKCECFPQPKFNPLFAFYKRVVSPQDIQKCSFYPSCSHYSALTFKQNGFFYGFADTFDRLLRCNGVDKPGYKRYGDTDLLLDYPLIRKR